MKILIISDSHDNIVRLRHVIGFSRVANLDAVIHCGDWNTSQAVSEVAKSNLPKFGVLGNADIDPQIERTLRENKIIFEEDFLNLNLGDKKIGVCHFPTGLNEAIMSQEYDILFCGHTHQRRDQKYRKTQVVNVGALHRTSSPCFVVYDTENNNVEFIDVAI